MTAPDPQRGPDPEDGAEIFSMPIREPAAPALDIDDLQRRSEPDEIGWLGRVQLWLFALLMSVPYRAGWALRRSPTWLWWSLRNPFRGLGRVIRYVWTWIHLSEERDAVRQMENKDARARDLRTLNHDSRVRLISAGVILGLWLIGQAVLSWGWSGYYAWLITVEWLGFYGILWALGHRRTQNGEEAQVRRGPLTHGTSTRTLRRDLEEGFLAKKMPEVGVINLRVNRFGWDGVFETEMPIDDKLVEHLERWVHAPPGALMLTADDRNAAAHPFRLLIDDPLRNVSKPDLPSEPRDIRNLATVGRHLFGGALQFNLRQHIGLIGRSGSGKSSGIWVLLDWITSCHNAEAAGIDLSGPGPAFPAWRRALRRIAIDEDQARELLTWAITEAKRRNALLAEWADSDTGRDDQYSEDWDPTPADKAVYIFIDEFHLVAADKALLELVKVLIRIGRKACIFVVLATPGSSKEDLGSPVIKGMIGLKILFACVIQDVTLFLGGSMAALGWRPDRLRPAAKDNPRDAGKAYVWDGDHQEPEVVRISRLDLPECKQRARSRPWEGPGDVPEPEERPQALDVLEQVLDDQGLDKISTGWLEKSLTAGDYGMDFAQVKAELDRLKITTSSVNRGPWAEANPRGYRRSDCVWPAA